MSHTHAHEERTGRIGVGKLIRQHWLSLGITFAVALIQIGIFYIAPTSVQTAMARSFDDPTWWSWLTYAYVHESMVHLASNMLVYLTGASLSWFVLGRRDKPKLYLGVLTILVVSAPPIIGGISHLIYTVAGYSFAYVKGFSGVGIAFGIFSYATVLSEVYLHHDETLGETLTYGISAIIFLIAALLSDSVDFAIVYSLSTVILLTGLGVIWFSRRTASARQITDWIHNEPLSYSLVILSAAIVLISLGALQPGSPGKSFPDIFAHYLGLVYGAVLGAAVHKTAI